MNVCIIEDEWSVTSISRPEPTVFFSVTEDMYKKYGCVIHQLACSKEHWEIAPIEDFTILSLTWEALVITIDLVIGADEAWDLDNWQLSDLELYSIFNEDGLYVFTTEEMAKMLPHLQAEAKSLNMS